MEFLKLKNLIFAIALAGSANWAQGAEATAVIKKFELRSCNRQGVCVQLKADRAESGQLTAIMSLSDIQVKLVQNGQTHSYQGRTGYVDMNRQSFVVRISPVKELSFDLNSLLVREYLL